MVEKQSHLLLTLFYGNVFAPILRRKLLPISHFAAPHLPGLVSFLKHINSKSCKYLIMSESFLAKMYVFKIFAFCLHFYLHIRLVSMKYGKWYCILSVFNPQSASNLVKAKESIIAVMVLLSIFCETLILLLLCLVADPGFLSISNLVLSKCEQTAASTDLLPFTEEIFNSKLCFNAVWKIL